jgi:hypothetical protein
MAKLAILKGTTSKLLKIFVQDSSATTGIGLSGLTNASGSLIGYYIREGDSSATAISIVSATVGTFTSGGFKEVDASHMKGVYEIGIPDAAIASGAKSVLVMLSGATNMAPVLLEIELTATDNQDSTRGGMSALPNGSMAVKKNAALAKFMFLMLDSTDHVTPKTGLTVTAERSIDAGSFASCANSVTELANGIYYIDLANTDLNGTVITFEFTATGADARYVTVVTQA